MFTILGASGYIGTELVSSLRTDGVECFAPPRGDVSVFARPLGHVIYAIGMTADFRSRPFETVRAHVSVLADVLEKADFDSLTYLSSTRVYARLAEALPDAALSVKPSDASDLYNLTKLTGESLCLNCKREGVRVVRLSNVVGPSSVVSDNFVDEIVREAVAGQLVMRSAPESSKDYILLEDVVRMIPQMAAEGTRTIYNLASGRNIRHSEWTDKLLELLGCEVIYQDGAPVLGFPKIEMEDTCREFGFSPRSVLDILPSLISLQYKLL